LAAAKLWAQENLNTQQLVSRSLVTALSRLVDIEMAELARIYVETFDFTEQQTLYLTAHELGDSRERGAALIHLHQILAAEGMYEGPTELPDYLPLWLEFFAVLGVQGQSSEVAVRMQKVCETIRDRLGEEHPYFFVLAAATELLAQTTAGIGNEDSVRNTVLAIQRGEGGDTDAEEEMPYPLFFV
jgi:nitrate reductase delta subunit